MEVLKSARHRQTWQVVEKDRDLLLVTQRETDHKTKFTTEQQQHVLCWDMQQQLLLTLRGNRPRHTRAKARMAVSQCLSVFGLHSEVLVVWGLKGWLRSTHHTPFQVPSTALTQPPTLLTSRSQTAYKQNVTLSANETPPSCPQLVSSASKFFFGIWLILSYFALSWGTAHFPNSLGVLSPFQSTRPQPLKCFQVMQEMLLSVRVS